MRIRAYLTDAAVVLIAACGDGSEPADSTASPPPITSTTAAPTTTAASTTAPPATITPDVGSWERVVMEQLVSPSCCDVPVVAPVSPPGPLPVDGWPDDGFYDIRVTRPAEPGATIDLEIHRWVPCTDFPDLCPPDPSPDGVVSDPNEWITRSLMLDDDSVGVVMWPLWTFSDDGPTALVGSGADLARLLTNGIDRAYLDWVVTPFEEGTEIDTLAIDLSTKATDEDFPFGRDAFEFSGWVYRAPLGARPVAPIEWLVTRDRPWPPGYNGLYDWWVTLEIRDGAPILHLYANQIAG